MTANPINMYTMTREQMESEETTAAAQSKSLPPSYLN